MFFRWVFALVVVLSSGSFANEELVERSRALRLSSHPQWKKLLYYSKRWFGSDRSLVRPGPFFLSPTGHVDPQAELEATIRMITQAHDFLQLNIDPPVSHHAQCRFPARVQWLKERLDFSNVLRMPCIRLNGFLSDVDADRVSLVFSSGYIGNPASMFGHTLFRLHKRGGGSPLLDHAVGFAAYPNTGNPILYAYRGGSGGFPGQFDVIPYYQKIQEYNNAESRDLWEYELDLAPAEVELMLKSIWEVGQNAIPYYYLDVNCASILFVLLDQTDMLFHFAEDIAVWVTPNDVTRSIAGSGLVRATRYSPSSLTRYLGRYENLSTDAERDSLSLLLSSNWGAYRMLDSTRKARVIDTALEFIDYTEKMSANKKAVSYAHLRSSLLQERSLIDVLPEPLPTPRASLDPREGHGSVRMGIGLAHDSSGTGIGLNWRPALHDVLGANSGFTGDLEIRFMDIHARIVPGFFLKRFGLLDIVSLNPKKPNMVPLSWRLALVMEEEGTPAAMRKYVRYALGWSVKFRSVLVYGMPLVDVGHSSFREQGIHAGMGIQAGVLFTPFEDIRTSTNLVFGRRFGQTVLDDFNVAVGGSVKLSKDSELRAENRWSSAGVEFLFSYAHYFWHFG